MSSLQYKEQRIFYNLHFSSNKSVQKKLLPYCKHRLWLYGRVQTNKKGYHISFWVTNCNIWLDMRFNNLVVLFNYWARIVLTQIIGWHVSMIDNMTLWYCDLSISLCNINQFIYLKIITLHNYNIYLFLERLIFFLRNVPTNISFFWCTQEV